MSFLAMMSFEKICPLLQSNYRLLEFKFMTGKLDKNFRFSLAKNVACASVLEFGAQFRISRAVKCRI